MQATSSNLQQATGAMAYPHPGSLNRLLFKTPLVWWRMGMGRLLGRYMLVLTTWGRTTRLPRHTMLSYTSLDGRIYLGAGWGDRSDWVRNLLKDPRVTLQLCSPPVTGMPGEMIIPALARRVTAEDEFRRVFQRLFETGGDTHFKPWLRSLGIANNLEDVMSKRERIHQVALDLQPMLPLTGLHQAGFPPPMPTDLHWVWAITGVSFALGWVCGRRKA